jgi:class 3 adenylate cyclase
MSRWFIGRKCMRNRVESFFCMSRTKATTVITMNMSLSISEESLGSGDGPPPLATSGIDNDRQTNDRSSRASRMRKKKPATAKKARQRSRKVSLRLVIGLLCCATAAINSFIGAFAMNRATNRSLDAADATYSAMLCAGKAPQVAAIFARSVDTVETCAKVVGSGAYAAPAAGDGAGWADGYASVLLQGALHAGTQHLQVGLRFPDGSSVAVSPHNASAASRVVHVAARHCSYLAGSGACWAAEASYALSDLANATAAPASRSGDSIFTASVVAAAAGSGAVWRAPLAFVFMGAANMSLPLVAPVANATGTDLGTVVAALPLSALAAPLATHVGAAFIVDQDGYLLASSLPDAVVSSTAAAAVLPGHCSAYTVQLSAASSATTAMQLCRVAAADYPFSPLQAAAASSQFMPTAGANRDVFADDDGAVWFGSAAGLPSGMTLVVLVSQESLAGGRNTWIFAAVSVNVVAWLACTVGAFALAHALLRPLGDVTRRMYYASRLQATEGRQELSFLQEVYALQKAYVNTNTAIQSFVRYVQRDVVKELLMSGELCEIKMVPMRISVLFVDIQDFTRMCERIPVDELAVLFDMYFAQMSDIVMRLEGTIDKFIGDCIMAIWGAPFTAPNHEFKATLCAILLHIETQVDPLTSAFDDVGERLDCRVGVGTGQVIAGNMGCEQRMNYTVIGDPVNLAARLESLNKQFGTRGMIAEDTAMHLGGVFVLRQIMHIQVVGRDEPVLVYEVLGVAALTLDADDAKLLREGDGGGATESRAGGGAAKSELSSNPSTRPSNHNQTYGVSTVSRLRAGKGIPSEEHLRRALDDVGEDLVCSDAQPAYARACSAAVRAFHARKCADALALLDEVRELRRRCGRCAATGAKSIDLLEGLCHDELRRTHETQGTFSGVWKADMK